MPFSVPQAVSRKTPVVISIKILFIGGIGLFHSLFSGLTITPTKRDLPDRRCLPYFKEYVRPFHITPLPESTLPLEVSIIAAKTPVPSVEEALAQPLYPDDIDREASK
jgi:hypothetical protein